MQQSRDRIPHALPRALHNDRARDGAVGTETG